MENPSTTAASTPAGFSFRLFRYGTKTDFLLIFISIVCNFASGIILPTFMALFGDVMDSVSTPGGRDMLFYVKLQLYFGAGAFVLCFVGAMTMEAAAEQQLHAVKKGFLNSIMRQEMGWFDEFDAGKLASTLSQNSSAIREGLGLKLAQLFMYFGMFIGGYAVGFFRSWKMTLVISSGIPVLGGCTYWLMLNMSRSDSVARQAYSAAASVVEETLLSIKTIAAYCLQNRFISKFTDNLQESYRAGIRVSMGVALTYGMVFGVFYCIEALGFWYGGRLIGHDLDIYDCYLDPDAKCFKGGQALGVFFAVIIGAFGLGQSGPSFSALAKASSAMAEVDIIISRKSAIDPFDESLPAVDRPRLEGRVVFNRVKFAYPSRKDRIVFSNFNLTIEPGKSIALVGGSGCGKSTIVQLIERYYDTDDGSVTIDNNDLKSISLRSWRQCVALVSQEPRLFATSIKENIRIGRLDASDEEVEQAAAQANAHGFIMDFPDRYDTFVGEGGNQLSGGQKQRIAIARAILRNPVVLILDEATSALDNESEKIVQETLDKLVESSRRTTIIIAHRLSTVRRADSIAVLQNLGDGAVVAEKGTHDELMQIPKGIYRGLVQAQDLSATATEEEVDMTAEDIALDMADLPNRSRSLLELHSKYSREISRLSKTNSKDSSILKSYVEEEDAAAAAAKKKKEKGPGSWFKVARLLTPYWYFIIIGLIGAVLNGLIFPAYSVLFAKMVSSFYLFTGDDVRRESSKWAIALVVLGIVSFLGACLQNGMFTWAGVKVVRTIRLQLFKSILYQDQSFFDDPKNSIGNLGDMLAADTSLIRGMVGDNVGIYLQNAVCIIAAIVVTFTSSPKLAGVAIGSFLLMAPAAAIESRFTLPPQETSEGLKADKPKDVESAAFILQETILNIRTVAAYTLEEKQNGNYTRIVGRDYDKGKKRSVITGLAWGVSQFAQYGCQALLIWYGGKLVADGEINPDKMLRGILALMMAAMGVGQSMSFATDNSKARAAADRIYTVLERRPLVDSLNENLRPFEGVRDSINFEKARFSYPSRPKVPVYAGLTFQIKKGEVVALVGQSGCGKSTVVQLLERLYPFGEDSEPNNGMDGAGMIKVDNVDIREYSVPSLRGRIGLVSQEPNLFATSVRENIELGKYGSDVTFSEVETAARSANAYNFIQDFPEGFETNVGRLGGQISGGQKQRIAIARALIRNPDILILDEATSALDAESEEIVQAALDKLIEEKRRTTLVIAHRLSTVKRADKIVVLVNKGKGSRVAEYGTHNELLKKPDGVYRKLVEIAEGTYGQQ